jgi:hypothetical protein
VPRVLVEPERAEQTMASLCRSKWSLQNLHKFEREAIIKDGRVGGVRDNVLSYLRGELPNARAPIFLYEPLGVRIDRILVHARRSAGRG